MSIRYVSLLACAAALSLVSAPSSGAAIILADDFSDANRSSINGTIGAWDTVNGIAAPSTTLQFIDGDSTTQVGFHNNSLNPGTFDVNNNMTAGGWDTTITLAVGGQNIDLGKLYLDLKLTNGSGAGQDTGNKSGQMLVEIFNASSASVGQDDLGGNVSYPTVSYQRELDLTGTTLLAGQTYTMVISARGTGFGHHKAFDAIELNGTIAPEPGSLALMACGGLMMIKRRR